MSDEDTLPPESAAATVGAGLVRSLMNFAVLRGADRQALSTWSGIRPEDIEDHDNRIAFSSYLALIKAAQELTGEPAFALYFGASVDMSEISVLGLLTHASETMTDALAQINRYGRLVIDTRVGASDLFELRRRWNSLWVADTRPRPFEIPELAEVAFAQLVCGTRRIGITGWLKSVHFTHPAPSYPKEYELVFQAPVVCGSDWNALEFDEAFVSHRVAVAPRFVFGILSDRAEELLESLERSKSVRGQVESLLMPILHTGDIGIDALAVALGLNRQSLYRKLKAEGVTFQEVVDELRRKLAHHYLQGNKVSVNEIAYLLGFSDGTAFSRAFKRWTGQSPRSWRLARSNVN